MKQTNPKLYNLNYFHFQSVSPNFSSILKPSQFHKKYREISSLLKLNPKDNICDYGCGNGDLSFFLSLKYNCSLTAIDYSPSAIKICRQKLKLFKKNTNPKANIKFINKNNLQIPKLKKIKAVFFCDVFEHLYDQEIDLVLSKISDWNSKPYILIHTDNNIYLKIIKPIIDQISLLSKITTQKQINRQNNFHKKRHINLTNPKQLNQKMKTNGFKLIKIKYPKPSVKIIESQIGKLSKFKLITKVCLTIIKKIPFLSPSFYALYQKSV